MLSRAPIFSLFSLISLSAFPVFAEGTDQLNPTQALREGTQLYVDIVDASVESFVWTGRGAIVATGPNGEGLGSYSSGEVISPSVGNGAYGLLVGTQQTVGTAWDVSVLNQTDSAGRLHSYEWKFNAGAFSSNRATYASFYAVVPGGGATSEAVIELMLDGLAGYVYEIMANRIGVNGVNGGKSVSQVGNSLSPEFRMYLNPPTSASYSTLSPNVANFRFEGGESTDVAGEAMTPCTEILPGTSRGYFYFDSNAEGTFHLQCDIDGDGDYSATGGEDLLITGACSSGTNVVGWNGLLNGTPVAVGSYDCRVRVNVGEFHYVGRDIETSYPGLRIFEVGADFTRTGLAMYWNDSDVQSAALNMPSGFKGLQVSEGTIKSGLYGDTTTANGNSRSWGNFVSTGKGNQTYLDTYVWLKSDESTSISLTAASDTDTDGDGLSDYAEKCLIGSDPTDTDTDGDGIPDNEQYSVPESSNFAGLESNGRLSTALARRAIRRTRLTPSSNSLMSTGPSQDVVALEMPRQVAGLSAEPRTPIDLLDLTNANRVAGADYFDGQGKRRAGVLLLESEGSYYEHERGICDRVRGGKLAGINEVPLNGTTLLEHTLVHPEEGRVEYARSLRFLWHPEVQKWIPQPHWLPENAVQPHSGQGTMSLQVWADSQATLKRLFDATIGQIHLVTPIVWPHEVSLIADQDYTPQAELMRSELLGGVTVVPAAVIRRVRTLGGEVTLETARRSGGGNGLLRATVLEEDGHTESVVEFPLADLSAPHTTQIDLGLFLDATLELVVDGKVEDRVWLSDGAWAPLDPELWSGESSSQDFSRESCDSRTLPRDSRGQSHLSLSGCVELKKSGKSTRVGAARHLTLPLDVGDFSHLAFWAQGAGRIQLCLQTQNDVDCVKVNSSVDGQWHFVPRDEFDVQGDVLLHTFESSEEHHPAVQLAGLTWVLDKELKGADRGKNRSKGGCVIAHDRSRFPWAASLLLIALGLRRRGRKGA